MTNDDAHLVAGTYRWPLTVDAAPDVAEWLRRQFARLDRVPTKDRCRLGVANDPTANTGTWDTDVVHDPTFAEWFRTNLRLGWDALRKVTDWAAAAGLTDGLPLTPPDRLIEPENMEIEADRSLDALRRHKDAVLVFLDGLSRGPDANDCYVTLLQAASIVSKSKRTLESMKGEMPPPDIKGGKGKAHEWKWSNLRPWLARTFKRPLPEIFPGDRFQRR